MTSSPGGLTAGAVKVRLRGENKRLDSDAAHGPTTRTNRLIHL